MYAGVLEYVYMWVSMYVFMCICVYARVCIHVCVQVSLNMCTWTTSAIFSAFFFKSGFCQAVVVTAHIFNTSTQEVETDGSL